ncbi:MAG: hypothetical protein IKE46_11740 [Selenomonadaceae bacterium]|nr:hypothetical protein [Selenomonadaceae bacterium]
MELLNTELVSSADYDDSYYDNGYYDSYNNGYNNGYYNNGYYNNGYNSNEGYTNDGVTVALFGYGSYTIDLSGGYYYPAVNINAAYSAGNNVLMGDYNANLIMAGSGASSLWGGQDFANDVLIGGSSYDMFYCSKYEGSDAILNGSSADTVWLRDVNLSDIVATYYDGTTITLQFNTGTVVAVACTDYYSPNFATADGGNYRFNRMTASWQ